MYGDVWFDSDEAVWITHPGGNYTDYFFTVKELSGQGRWKGTGWVMGQKFPSDLDLSAWWANENPSWTFDPFTMVEVSLVTSNPQYNCGQGSWNLRTKTFSVCPAGMGCRFSQDNDEPKITFGPNPASDEIKFFNMDIGMHDFSVDIFDLTGHLIRTEKQLTQEFINIDNMIEGVYLLKIYKDGTYQSTEKLVVFK